MSIMVVVLPPTAEIGCDAGCDAGDVKLGAGPRSS